MKNATKTNIMVKETSISDEIDPVSRNEKNLKLTFNLRIATILDYVLAWNGIKFAFFIWRQYKYEINNIKFRSISFSLWRITVLITKF